MEKYTLNQAQREAASSIVNLGLSQDEQLRRVVVTLFTPEVLADKTAYTACRNELQTVAITERQMTPDSARTFVYRLLQRADISAPGKNAGADNGKAKASEAKEQEAAAIVAQGETAIIAALAVALKAADFSKMRKIVDAAQAAHKAATEAAKAA